MELVFLDRASLAYKDYAIVDDVFEIHLDLVVIQKSRFRLNKGFVKALVGDLVILRNAPIPYLGIVERFERASEHQMTVDTLDFREIFAMDVLVPSFQGDIAFYLQNLLEQYFKTSTDALQNLDYLTIQRETSVEGELIFEADRLMPLSELMELITKTYGLSLKAEARFLRGRVTGITFWIQSVTKGMKLKSNFQAIRDLMVSDAANQTINKLILYPKSENVIGREVLTYYSLTNGEMTQDATHPNRYSVVKSKSLLYSDNELDTLPAKVRQELLTSKLDHNISFMIDSFNEVFQPLQTANLGDFLEFHHQGKVYDSILTSIRFINTFQEAMITLGEYRMKLTEKIQLLNKNVKSVVSTMTSSQGGTHHLDGGEF